MAARLRGWRAGWRKGRLKAAWSKCRDPWSPNNNHQQALKNDLHFGGLLRGMLRGYASGCASGVCFARAPPSTNTYLGPREKNTNPYIARFMGWISGQWPLYNWKNVLQITRVAYVYHGISMDIKSNSHHSFIQLDVVNRWTIPMLTCTTWKKLTGTCVSRPGRTKEGHFDYDFPASKTPLLPDRPRSQ